MSINELAKNFLQSPKGIDRPEYADLRTMDGLEGLLAMAIELSGKPMLFIKPCSQGGMSAISILHAHHIVNRGRGSIISIRDKRTGGKYTYQL